MERAIYKSKITGTEHTFEIQKTYKFGVMSTKGITYSFNEITIIQPVSQTTQHGITKPGYHKPSF